MRLRLPSLSERSPALPASTVAKRIELMTRPSRKGVSPSSSSMNKIAPEIVPVS
jgi:copper homeostasis protein CutC